VLLSEVVLLMRMRTGKPKAHHAVGQRVLLVEQDLDEEGVGAGVLHVRYPQQRRRRVQHLRPPSSCSDTVPGFNHQFIYQIILQAHHVLELMVPTPDRQVARATCQTVLAVSRARLRSSLHISRLMCTGGCEAHRQRDAPQDCSHDDGLPQAAVAGRAQRQQETLQQYALHVNYELLGGSLEKKLQKLQAKSR
jgi:hypothetical protein